MGERTTYFCDICGKNIPDFDPNMPTDDYFVSYAKDGLLEEFDACDECLDKVNKLIQSIKEYSGGFAK